MLRLDWNDAAAHWLNIYRIVLLSEMLEMTAKNGNSVTVLLRELNLGFLHDEAVRLFFEECVQQDDVEYGRMITCTGIDQCKMRLTEMHMGSNELVERSRRV